MVDYMWGGAAAPVAVVVALVAALFNFLE
jgi:hypothetical protein